MTLPFVNRSRTGRRRRATIASMGRLEALEARQLLSTFTVTSTLDDGSTGTLRWAIGQVNADTADSATSPDQIAFNIPGTGPFTISPTTELPTVVRPVVIDGYSQPGAHPNTLANGDDAAILIQLARGESASPFDGLTIAGGSSTVDGLSITGFNNGVHLEGPGNDAVVGDFIGLNADGTTAAGNSKDGVLIDSGSSSTIGGTTPAVRNVIAGAKNFGVLDSEPIGNNLIEGNYIGTDPTGTEAIGNGGGVVVMQNDVIRGNVISGNNGHGITLGNTSLVQDNFIGTDATGTKALGNGITFPFDGINITGDHNTIGGVNAGNVISGNLGTGILLNSPLSGFNLIQGNRIGTDISGTTTIGNGFFGIAIVAQQNSTIGGTTPGTGNLISGNTASGIAVEGGSGLLVEGNLIGTDATGTKALGNGNNGILTLSGNNTIGGTTSGSGNIISGNVNYGILVGAPVTDRSGILVEGNFIGTDVTGTKALGNQRDGIIVESPNNTIGGTVAAANTLAYNSGAGVSVIDFFDISNIFELSTGNAILSNRIHDNGKLGIDLNDDGVTSNTPGGPHFGPNFFQNYPVLLAADSSASSTTIVGTLNSTPNTTFTVQFFSNPAADPSGHGQGQTYLGELTGVKTDANGNASFSFVAPVAVLGQFLSATATDAGGNTSEFAQDIQEGAVPIADLAIIDPSVSSNFVMPNTAETYQFTITNNGPSAATNVSSTIMVPAHTTFFSLTSSDPNVTFQSPPVGGGTGTTIDLHMPEETVGHTVTITLVVFVEPDTSPGTVITNTENVASDDIDPDHSNNSATQSVQVVQTGTSTAITSVQPSAPTFGQPVTFTATVTPGVLQDGPSGTITFSIDGVPQAPSPVVPTDGGFAGLATFTASGLAAGVHTITASYSGDASFDPSVSRVFSVTVGQAATTTTLSVAPSTTTVGQPVTLTATVSGPGTLGGAVDFFDGSTLIGTATIGQGGTGVLVLTSLAAGSHSLSAAYLGDPNHLASASSAVIEVITPVVPTGDGPRVLAVDRFGYHAMPTVLVLHFDQPLDAAGAENPANYVLIGPKHQTIRVKAAVLDPGSMAVTLSLRERLNVHLRYTLIVEGASAGGLRGTSGLLLDGAGNGVPGSNYVTSITSKNLRGASNGHPIAAPRHVSKPAPHASGHLAQQHASKRSR